MLIIQNDKDIFERENYKKINMMMFKDTYNEIGKFS